jgi:hypothetical protein
MYVGNTSLGNRNGKSTDVTVGSMGSSVVVLVLVLVLVVVVVVVVPPPPPDPIAVSSFLVPRREAVRGGASWRPPPATW